MRPFYAHRDWHLLCSSSECRTLPANLQDLRAFADRFAAIVIARREVA
jgi:hypothetical protein